MTETMTTPDENEVLLPQTPEALDVFVAGITKEFGLPEGDDTYDTIATMIMHMPQTKVFVCRSSVANYVRKSIANAAAYTRLIELQGKRAEKAKAEQEKLKLVENGTSSENEPTTLQNA